MKSTMAERIYDTLFNNTDYPQFETDKVKDSFVQAGKDNKAGDTGIIELVYGRVAYKIIVERLAGYHNDITTIKEVEK